jgi:hypothetical protein
MRFSATVNRRWLRAIRETAIRETAIRETAIRETPLAECHHVGGFT